MRKRATGSRTLSTVAARWVDIHTAVPKATIGKGFALLLRVDELASVVVAAVWPIFTAFQGATTGKDSKIKI